MTNDHCDNCGCMIGKLERREMFGSAIVCTDCHRQLVAQQRKAAAGPLPYATPVGDVRPTVTVELTAKRWKAHQAMAAVIIAVGVLMFIVAAAMQSRAASAAGGALTAGGVAVFVGGVTYYIVARVAAWWHHG